MSQLDHDQTAPSHEISHHTILGVPVSRVTMNSAVDRLADWIEKKQKRYICASDVHSVMRAQDEASHMEALRDADMVLPDGTPLVWVSHLRGERDISRVPGPDFMLAAVERSVKEGWRHYFYGAAEGVAGLLAQTLSENYPGLNVAGTGTPPFRPLTEQESEESLAHIRAARPDIVWVGLGCPKQERWMHEHLSKLDGVVLVGVGAAFDFHAGRVSRAPLWMRSNGFEWLHRLACEPQRLWRRYLLQAPRFVFFSLKETLVLRRSSV